MIIHDGTNDIWGPNKRQTASSEEIGNDLVDVGLKCRGAGIRQIYISGVPPTKLRATNDLARQVNEHLRSFCNRRDDFTYIDNWFLANNIRENLDRKERDLVHLSKLGQRRLCVNFGSVLRSSLLS